MAFTADGNIEVYEEHIKFLKALKITVGDIKFHRLLVDILALARYVCFCHDGDHHDIN